VQPSLFVAITLLGHFLLAAIVGSHAEVHGRRQWRWAMIVLLTGLLGALWYVQSDPDPHSSDRSRSDTEEQAIPEAVLPSEWDEDASRRKRLADPNTLHLDLPDGTTLTGSERAAVGGLLEQATERAAGSGEWSGAMDATGEHHGDVDLDWSRVDVEALVENVFETQDAGYAHVDVWWTDCIRPALSGLPDVTPPPESDVDAYTVDFRIRERYRDDETRAFLVDDGERTGEFERRDGEIQASAETYREHGPGWVSLARDRIAAEFVDQSDRTPSRFEDERRTRSDDEPMDQGEPDHL
jgi:hypothetical protein